MLPITSIVIASDLTQPSTVALARAVSLKAQLGAHLTVLHVLEATTAADLSEQPRRQAVELLAAQLRSVTHEELRHLWLKVVEGEADKTIIAEAMDADLIILGDGRKAGWRERFGGTTTERLVRMSERPVLIARRPAERPYQRLFSAFDGSAAACRALSIGLSIANEAQCLVMHANETRIAAEFASRRAANALAKRHLDTVMTELRTTLQDLAPLPAQPQVKIVEGNAHFLIREGMRDFSPDLVVAGTHARSAVATAFLGSFAADLLADTDCDVLIAPPERS
jgi:nucleotide-binding universal stress UspA family protein